MPKRYKLPREDKEWTQGKHKAEGSKMRAHFGKRKDKARAISNLKKAQVKAAAQGRKIIRLVDEFRRSLDEAARRAFDRELDLKRIMPRREPKHMAIPNFVLRTADKTPDEVRITYPFRSKKDLEALEEIYGIDLRIGEKVRIQRKSAMYPTWYRDMLERWAAERAKEDEEDMRLKEAAGQVIDFPTTKKEKKVVEKAEKKRIKQEETAEKWDAALELYKKMFPDRA